MRTRTLLYRVLIFSVIALVFSLIIFSTQPIKPPAFQDSISVEYLIIYQVIAIIGLIITAILAVSSNRREAQRNKLKDERENEMHELAMKEKNLEIEKQKLEIERQNLEIERQNLEIEKLKKEGK